MLASIALGLVSLLPEQALFSWGWRLPFLASIILLAVGWYIRVKVPESPDFEKVKQQSEEVKVPAFQVLKPSKTTYHHYFGESCRKCMVLYCFNFTLAYTTTQLGIPRQDILFATICGAAVILFMTPLCGHLSDKVGQRNMFMFGLCVLALYSYPFLACSIPKIRYWSGRQLFWQLVWCFRLCMRHKLSFCASISC